MDRDDYLSSYGPPYGDDEKVLESINSNSNTNNDDLKKHNNKYIQQNTLSNSVETFQSSIFRKNPQEKSPKKFTREIPVKNSFAPDPDVEFIHQWKKKPFGVVKQDFHEKTQKFRSKPLPKRELPKFVSQIQHEDDEPVVQVPVIEEKDFKRQANEYPPPPPPPDVAGNSNVEYEFKDNVSETEARQENIGVDFTNFERPFGFPKPKRELTKDSPHHPHSHPHPHENEFNHDSHQPHSHPHPHENEVNHDSHQHPHSHPHESQDNHYHGEFVHQNNNNFPPHQSPKFDFIKNDFDSNAQLRQKPDLKQVNPISHELISFEPDPESVGYQQFSIHNSDTFIEFPKHKVKEDEDENNNQVVVTSYGGNGNGNNEQYQTFESSFGTTLTNGNVNQDEFEYIETKDVPSYPNQLTFGGNLNKDHNKSIFGTTFGDVGGNGNKNNKERTKKETESKSYSYFETSFGKNNHGGGNVAKTAPEIQLFKTLNVNEADNTKSIFGTTFHSAGAGNGNPNKERAKKETGNKSYSYFGTNFGSDNHENAVKDIDVPTTSFHSAGAGNGNSNKDRAKKETGNKSYSFFGTNFGSDNHENKVKDPNKEEAKKETGIKSYFGTSFGSDNHENVPTTTSIWSTTFNQPADQPAKTNIKERNIPKFKPTKLTKPFISVKPREDHFHWNKNSQPSSFHSNNLLNEHEIISNGNKYFPPTTLKLTSERKTTKLDNSGSFTTFHNDLNDFKNNASPVFREIPEPLPNPLSHNSQQQQQKHRRHHQTSSLFNHEVNQVNTFLTNF